MPKCSLSLIFLFQKSYETKQYKKGLKAADSILKKFPDHGGIFCFMQYAIWYSQLADLATILFSLFPLATSIGSCQHTYLYILLAFRILENLTMSSVFFNQSFWCMKFILLSSTFSCWIVVLLEDLHMVILWFYYYFLLKLFSNKINFSYVSFVFILVRNFINEGVDIKLHGP